MLGGGISLVMARMVKNRPERFIDANKERAAARSRPNFTFFKARENVTCLEAGSLVRSAKPSSCVSSCRVAFPTTEAKTAVTVQLGEKIHTGAKDVKNGPLPASRRNQLLLPDRIVLAVAPPAFSLFPQVYAMLAVLSYGWSCKIQRFARPIVDPRAPTEVQGSTGG